MYPCFQRRDIKSAGAGNVDRNCRSARATEQSDKTKQEVAFRYHVGILFIHGIGAQRRGQTLAEFGGPIYLWLVDRFRGLDRRWREAINDNSQQPLLERWRKHIEDWATDGFHTAAMEAGLTHLPACWYGQVAPSRGGGACEPSCKFNSLSPPLWGASEPKRTVATLRFGTFMSLAAPENSISYRERNALWRVAPRPTEGHRCSTYRECRPTCR